MMMHLGLYMTQKNGEAVIPAKAGIQQKKSFWIPAYAGMTKK
jgi:hypothetical protein